MNPCVCFITSINKDNEFVIKLVLNLYSGCDLFLLSYLMSFIARESEEGIESEQVSGFVCVCVRARVACAFMCAHEWCCTHPESAIIIAFQHQSSKYLSRLCVNAECVKLNI